HRRSIDNCRTTRRSSDLKILLRYLRMRSSEKTVRLRMMDTVGKPKQERRAASMTVALARSSQLLAKLHREHRSLPLILVLEEDVDRKSTRLNSSHQIISN